MKINKKKMKDEKNDLQFINNYLYFCVFVSGVCVWGGIFLRGSRVRERKKII